MYNPDLLGTLVCIYLLSCVLERWRLEELVENSLMGSGGAEGPWEEDILGGRARFYLGTN